jgi:hypothetical protein
VRQHRPSPAVAPLAASQANVRRRFGMLDQADQLIARPSEDPAQRGYSRWSAATPRSTAGI